MVYNVNIERSITEIQINKNLYLSNTISIKTKNEHRKNKENEKLNEKSMAYHIVYINI
jgi:hypothetical protein